MNYFTGKSRKRSVLLLITGFGVLILAFAWFNFSEVFLPKPTDGILEESDEVDEDQLRIQWIEHMHQAAPGANWKQIEQQTRLEKYMRGYRSVYRTSQTASVDTIANGALTGMWSERGSVNQSGRIVVAEFDSIHNKIYCGSAGGVVWKGNSNGTGWTALNDRLKFNSIIMIKVVPNGTGQRILVGCSGEPFFCYSDDDGSTWINSNGISYISNWGNVERTLVTSDSLHNVYMLVHEWDSVAWDSQTTIYKSDNLGSSFHATAAYPKAGYGETDNFDIWSPQKDDTVYIINQHGSNVSLYKFDPVSGIPNVFSNFSFNSGNKILLTGINTSPRILYAYSDKFVYRSNNGGTTWVYKSTLAESYFSRNSFCCSLVDSNNIFFGGMQTYKSLTGGANFILVNSWQNYYNNPSGNLHADIPCIIPYNDNGEKFFIGTDGGLYTSSDSLHTVHNLSLYGLNAGQYYSTYTNRNDPNFIFAGAQDQGYQRCQYDSGTILGFNQKVSGDYSHLVSSDGGNSIWMVYPSFAAYIANAKTTSSQWSASWDFNGATNFWMPPLLADPFGDPEICYVAGKFISTSGSHIIKMERTGSNISAIELPFDFLSASSGGYVSAIAASSINANDWYAITDNGKFFYSSDAGQNWSQSLSFSGPSPHYFYGSAIYASKLTPGKIIIGGSGYSNSPVYVSTDFGQTFLPIDSGLPPTLVFEITADENEDFLFAATEAGPYVYSFTDGRWYDMSAVTAPDQVYWGVDYIPLTHTVRFATYGRGIWDFKIQSGLLARADIGESNDINIYPNPGTGIFQIKSFSAVNTVKIYNSVGKLVCNKKDISFIDISNETKGIYFVELESEGRRFVKKILLE